MAARPRQVGRCGAQHGSAHSELASNQAWVDSVADANSQVNTLFHEVHGPVDHKEVHFDARTRGNEKAGDHPALEQLTSRPAQSSGNRSL